MFQNVSRVCEDFFGLEASRNCTILYIVQLDGYLTLNADLWSESKLRSLKAKCLIF